MRYNSRLAALPAVILLAACGSAGSTGGSAPADATAHAVSVTLDAQNFRFTPGLVSARPGDKVTVTVINKDAVEHNFSIAELNVSQDVEKGATSAVTFTATGTTNLQFFCKYHKARGMVGTLGLGGPNTAPAASSAPGSDKPYGSGY